MYFEGALFVPAGTTKEDPVEMVLKLTEGVITKIEVEFPYGPNFLVSAYVGQAIHQIWPINPDGYVVSDGHVVSAQEYVEMFQPPYEMICGAYGPDCVYDHTLRFRVELTPKEVAERGSKMQSWLTRLMQLLGAGG